MKSVFHDSEKENAENVNTRTHAAARLRSEMFWQIVVFVFFNPRQRWQIFSLRTLYVFGKVCAMSAMAVSSVVSF